MTQRRKNAGEGYGYMFSGAFAKKADAMKKEKTRKGSFIKSVYVQGQHRYAVMTPRTNPIKRKKKPETQKNPLDLMVMGANPAPAPSQATDQTLTVPAGSTITIRMNPVNPLGFHPGLMTGRQQRAHYGRVPFNRRVAALVRKAKGTRAPKPSSDVKTDVQAALVNQGYTRTAAKKAIAGAQGGDFSALFNDAMRQLRENPVCGSMIGGEPCSRLPGHIGPHLPQGATMRPRSRLRGAWKPRGNPSAEALREAFTGMEVDKVTINNEPHMPAGDYAGLGQALALYVKPMRGGQVQEIVFSGREKTRLVSDESGQQIYFVGGDQDISDSLHKFGAIEREGMYELGEARRIDYKQRKEHVPDPDADGWRHEFGEETGVRPTVLFDPRHKKLLLVGGEYEIRPEGIVN